jgi:hypothetical protein
MLVSSITVLKKIIPSETHHSYSLLETLKQIVNRFFWAEITLPRGSILYKRPYSLFYIMPKNRKDYNCHAFFLWCV